MNETEDNFKEAWQSHDNTRQEKPPDDHQLDDSEKVNENNTTKNIILYRNGDKYFPPKRFVVNKRYIRTWDSFLEELTKSVQPRNGAIREIRTPYHGTKIEGIDNLTLNGKYVAVSKGEILKLIDYTSVVDVAKPANKAEIELRRLKTLKPMINHEMDKIETRIYQLNTKGFYIHVYRNGDPFTRGIKVVLNQFEQKHMSTLVRAIEDRVLLQSNKPIRRLYTMDGTIIRYAKDVENGQYYVAAANEPFYNIKYGQYLPVIRGGKVPSSRHRIKYLNKSPTPVTSRPTVLNEESNEETYRTQKALYTDRSKQKPATHRYHKNDEMEYQNEDKEKAATKIQTAYRRHSARNRDLKAREENGPKPRNNNQQEPKSMKKQPEENDQNKKPQERRQYIQNRPDNNGDEKEKKKVNEKSPATNNKSNGVPKKKDYSRQNVSEQKAKEELAATKIQAAFRGYKHRKPIAKDKAVNKVENKVGPVKVEEKKKEILPKKEETQKKNDVKAKEDPKKKEDNKEKQEKNNDEEKERAAISIQAGFRGYKTRARLVKDDGQERREKAATIIQSGYRGYITRKRIQNREETKRRQEAATKIQSGYRGYEYRKQSQTKVDSRNREESAKVIQYAYRGYLARKRIREREEQTIQENAASIIQAGYKAYQTRKTIKSDMNARLQEKTAEEQAKERNEAAAKIQANFRGHNQRMRMRQP